MAPGRVPHHPELLRPARAYGRPRLTLRHPGRSTRPSAPSSAAPAHPRRPGSILPPPGSIRASLAPSPPPGSIPATPGSVLPPPAAILPARPPARRHGSTPPGPAPSSRRPANSAIFSPGEHRIRLLRPPAVIRSPGGHWSPSLTPVMLRESSQRSRGPRLGKDTLAMILPYAHPISVCQANEAERGSRPALEPSSTLTSSVAPARPTPSPPLQPLRPSRSCSPHGKMAEFGPEEGERAGGVRPTGGGGGRRQTSAGEGKMAEVGRGAQERAGRLRPRRGEGGSWRQRGRPKQERARRGCGACGAAEKPTLRRSAEPSMRLGQRRPRRRRTSWTRMGTSAEGSSSIKSWSSSRAS